MKRHIAMHGRGAKPAIEQAGFTLIEAMIVVVIIALLTSIAYPSYLQYTVRTNRQAARSAIYAIADRQEQFFIDNKQYGDGLATLGYDADTVGIGRDGQWTGDGDADRTYSLTISESSATSYTVQATPQGMQADRDTDCGTLTLTSTGERDQSGGGDTCW